MKKYKVLLVLFAIAIVAIGCCNDIGYTSNSKNPIPPSINALSFDRMAPVPVIGNNDATAYVTVRNNTGSQINNISYYTDITQSSSFTQVLLKKIFATLGIKKVLGEFSTLSTANCSQLSAYQACQLTLPLQVDNTLLGGSVAVSARYTDGNGKSGISGGVINYLKISPNQTGLNFTDGLNVPANPNMTQHVWITGYYISPTNTSITNLNVSSSNPGFIIQSSLPKELASNSSFTILITIPPTSVAIYTKVSITGTAQTSGLTKVNDNNTLSSSTEIGTYPFTNGPFLFVGIAPTLTLSQNANIGSFALMNIGNQTANISFSQTAGSSTYLNILGGCPSSLSAGNSCTESYNVIESLAPTTNTNVGITITSNSLNPSISVVTPWYESGFALVSGNANPSSLNVIENYPIPPVSETITLNNIGAFPVTLDSVTTKNTSSNLSFSNIIDNCSNQPLAVGSTCTYSFNVADSAVENATLSFTWNASYYKSGQQNSVPVYVLIQLTSSAGKPSLSFDPNPQVFSMIANTSAQPLSVSESLINSGNISATLTPFYYDVNSESIVPITISSNCGSTLSNGSTCTVTESFATIPAGLITSTQTGTAIIIESYSNPTSTYYNTATESINWTFYAESVNLNESISASNATGDGKSSGTAYTFEGCNPSPKSITLTISNVGGVTLTNVQVIEPNLSFYWIESTTCSGTLSAGDNCTITYTPNYANLFGQTPTVLAGTMNLTNPKIVANSQTSTQLFNITPNIIGDQGQTIYVSYDTAVITPTARIIGSGANESYFISYKLTGCADDDVTGINVNAIMNAMSTESSVSNANGRCSAINQNSIMYESCSFAGNGDEESLIFAIDPLLESNGNQLYINYTAKSFVNSILVLLNQLSQTLTP